ncbi:MAG: glycosyltransferase, partial [Planctomycetes bacterium]|nr:glycosyltransferase [Planctomycetota bacterium]
IVVDDESRPPAAQRNEDICHGRPGCRYLHVKRPLGAPAARNRGLAESRARYVWFMDDDDYASQRTVSDVVESLRSNPTPDSVILLPRDLVFGGVRIRHVVPVDEPNKCGRYRAPGPEVTTSCAVFLRRVLEEVGGWDERMRSLQDTGLFLRVARVATFRCLQTEPLIVDVSSPRRISTRLCSTQIGKIQFLRKHWRVLSRRRKLRYILSILLFAPAVKRFRLWAKVVSGRRRCWGPVALSPDQP